MGYNGLGLQRWIYNMKPRKFLGKRSKPDGGGGENHAGTDINNFYRLNKNDLNNLLQKKYSPKYKNTLLQQLHEDSKKRKVFNFISLFLALFIVCFLLIYLIRLFEWF